MGLITQPHTSFDAFREAFRGQSGDYGYARYFYTDERDTEEELARYAGSQDAAIFNSGMAGIVTLMETLMLPSLPALRVSDVLYSQTKEYFESLRGRVIVSTSSVNDGRFYRLWGHDEQRLIIFVETVGNGYEMPVADIEMLLKMIAADNIWLIIDNTFLTTTLFDVFALVKQHCVQNRVVVVESATKYYHRGEDKITAGVVFGPKRILQKIKERRAMMGTYLQPMCIDQLPVCMDILHRNVMPRHSRNALELAQFLERQSRVVEVKYPLLASHPQYELSRKMFPNGAGGLFFFKLRGGKSAAKKFVDSLGYCQIGGSFGHDTTWVAPLDAVKDGDTGIIRVAAGFKRGDRKETICDFERALGKL